MSFFEKQVTIRIRDTEFKAIEKICNKHPEKYYNASHFIRVALKQKIQEHENIKW